MINERVYEGFRNLSEQLENMSGFKLILPSWNDVNQLGEKALVTLCMPGKEVQDFQMNKKGLDQCRRAVSLAKLDRPLDTACDSWQSVKVPHVTETVRVRLEPVRFCKTKQIQETSADADRLEKVQKFMSKEDPEIAQKTLETSVDNDQQENAQESTPDAEPEQVQETLPDTDEQEEKDPERNILDASVMGEYTPEKGVLPKGWKKVTGADWGLPEAIQRGLCLDNKGKGIPELYSQAIRAAYSL